MSGNRESGSDWLGAGRHASASSLAAFAEGALPADEMRAIAAHVAGCDECAERVAAYAEVDSLVRAAPPPMPPAALRAGLFTRIGAETRQASGRRSEADREALAREIEAPAFPAVDTAPDVPSSPANPSRAPLPPIPAIARWGGAVAATLIVTLLASVFITLGQSRTSASTVTRATATIQRQPTATVLQQPACAPNQLQAHLPARTHLNDLAMTSAGTGWAVGATADSDSSATTYHSLIMRLSDCKWEPFGARLPNAQLQSLAMVSLAEGWAAGAQGQKPLLFHYENGSWSAVTPPPTGDIIRFFIVRVGPSGEVWVAGLSPSANAGRDGIVILRLSGGQWKRIETPFVEAYDIAPVAPGDAWIIGRKTPSANVSFEELAHVRDSSLVSESPLDGAITLTHLRMISATDGWAMGDLYLGGGDTTDNPQVSRAIALHYDGVKWAEGVTGARTTARVVDVLGQGTAWSYTTKGVPEFIVSTQRQVAGQWRDVPWPFKDIVSFSRLTCVAQDDCWAIGFYLWPSTGEITSINFAWLLLRYANGAWREYGHAT
jgi:anti-sigma factor RsiW